MLTVARQNAPHLHVTYLLTQDPNGFSDGANAQVHQMSQSCHEKLTEWNGSPAC